MKVLICGARRRRPRHRRAAGRRAQQRDGGRFFVRRAGAARRRARRRRSSRATALIPMCSHRAGAADCDILFAVTPSDEVNITACTVSHTLFNVPTKIARRARRGLPHQRLGRSLRARPRADRRDDLTRHRGRRGDRAPRDHAGCRREQLLLPRPGPGLLGRMPGRLRSGRRAVARGEWSLSRARRHRGRQEARRQGHASWARSMCSRPAMSPMWSPPWRISRRCSPSSATICGRRAVWSSPAAAMSACMPASLIGKALPGRQGALHRHGEGTGALGRPSPAAFARASRQRPRRGYLARCRRARRRHLLRRLE